MPERDLTILPATPSDAAVGASLIHRTMGRMGEFLFGAGKASDPERTVAELFARPRNRLSYQFAMLGDLHGETVGLLQSYPGRLLRPLAFGTARELVSLYGVKRFLSFLGNALRIAGVREAQRDEYFVHALAVFPPFQGMGFGSQLLAYAESEARAGGLRKCALTVDAANAGALHLYQSRGYRIVKTVDLNRIPGIGAQRLHRLVKDLRWTAPSTRHGP